MRRPFKTSPYRSKAQQAHQTPTQLQILVTKASKLGHSRGGGKLYFRTRRLRRGSLLGYWVERGNVIICEADRRSGSGSGSMLSILR